MTALATPSNPESRLFRGFWQDGALDLSAGLALTTMGVFWLTGPVVGQTLAPLVAFVLFPILRKRVTEPRFGHVRFNAKRRSRLRRGHWILVGLGTAAFVLGIGVYLAGRDAVADSPLAATLVPGLPPALLGVMAIGGAAMLGLQRFLVYAAFLMCSGGAVIVLGAHPGWALLASGLFVTAFGSSLMVRFVRAYPVAMTEVE